MRDSRVRKITFTGSTPVGKYLMREATDTVKKLSLELGGHAPFIVFDDADLDRAVEGAVQSKFRNSGQTCISANRIYIHESIKQEFIEKLKLAVSKLQMGDGFSEGMDLGPLIDGRAVLKVQEHVNDALLKGAQLECGGRITTEIGENFFESTILSNVNDHMICMQQETFGPLALVTIFKTEEEVIERVNHSNYGLAAYLYTESLSRAYKVSEKLDYGIIGINDDLPSTAQAPFGGMKESGLGREGGREGIDEFLETKYLSIRL